MSFYTYIYTHGLKWNIPQEHSSAVVRCPYTFDHLVYLFSIHATHSIQVTNKQNVLLFITGEYITVI